MPFVGRVVSVGTTPTVILEGTAGRGSNAIAGLITNTDADTVYLGGSGVTTTDGYPFVAGAELPIGEIGDGDDLYGIVASGTAAVRVLELQ